MPALTAAIALDKFTTFGDLLKYLRRRAGLTQRELSIAVGYSDTHLSRLEQNERLPDLAMITAQFVPALGLEHEPELARRLLELAAAVRREDAPAAGLPPFKGLYYFDEADAGVFFGRETLTTRLVARVHDLASTPGPARCLAIVGASGSGKSSVVRAGLIPALHWSPHSASWPIHVLTPGAHPLEALAGCLTAQARPVAEKTALAENLARETRQLHLTLQQKARRGGASHALLVVDQFEEVFTLCRSQAERQAFIDSLLTAAAEPDGPALVVIALRADFYAHCAGFPQLRAALAQQQEYIGAMTPDELRLTIEEPARHGHWQLEPRLVELLLQEVGDEPGALPLLSHALLETWERRRGRTLTLSGYLASGGVRGAIAETAEAVFQDRLDAAQRAIARRIFLRLTELGEGTQETRRRAALTELVLQSEDASAVESVLTTLADARLVITSQETAEVAHEALIREWPTLRQWLAEDRENLRLQRHMTEAAQEWARMDRDEGGLYRGARLAQAREWAGAHAGELNALEREFLDASQALAEREAVEREARRQRELEAAQRLAEVESRRAEEQSSAAVRLRRRALYLAGAFILALAMAGIALVFGEQARQSAIRAENEGRIAYSRELAASAIGNLDVDPERSILLALEAVSVAQTAGLAVPREAADALHRAVKASRTVLVLSGHADAVGAVAYSPDGRRIATASADNTARVWDAASGDEMLVLAGHSAPVNDVAFNPDGERLATTSEDGTAKIWNPHTGAELLTLKGHTEGVLDAAFSPNGARLATTSKNGGVKIWDANTGRELLSLPAHGDWALSAAFSPDGNRLVTAGFDATMKFWDAETGEELRMVEGEFCCMVFSPNGSRMASGFSAGGKILDVASGQELLTVRGHTNLVFGMAIDRAWTQMATGGMDQKIKVWDAATGDTLLTLAGHTGAILSLAFSPDGVRLASASEDWTVRVWDLSLSRELFTLATADGDGRVAFSPDGTLLAAGDHPLARVWNAATGQEVAALESHATGLIAATFSPDGKQLATGGADHTAIVWDVAAWEKAATLRGHLAPVMTIAFSPDGRRLATGSEDNTAVIWDIISQTPLITLTGHTDPVIRAVFSPDGRQLATGSVDHTVRIWDSSTGEVTVVLSDHTSNVWGITYSPDGTRLVTSSSDATAIVWDTTSWTKLRTLVGHSSAVVLAVFSPDGRQIATASRDGTAKLWDAATGDQLVTFMGDGRSGLNGVAFSPDGSRLVTGGDRGVSVYVLRVEELVSLAQRRVTRSLRPEECRQYLHSEQCPTVP
jgi:WD40 repeat protein